MILEFLSGTSYDKTAITFPRGGVAMDISTVKTQEGFPHYEYLADWWLLSYGINPDYPPQDGHNIKLLAYETAAEYLAQQHPGNTGITVDKNQFRTWAGLWKLFPDFDRVLSFTKLPNNSQVFRLYSPTYADQYREINQWEYDVLVRSLLDPAISFFAFILDNVPTAWKRYATDKAEIMAKAMADTLKSEAKNGIISRSRWIQVHDAIAAELLKALQTGNAVFNYDAATRWQILGGIISRVNDTALPFGYSIDVWIEQPDYVTEQADQIIQAANDYGSREENFAFWTFPKIKEPDPAEQAKNFVSKWGMPVAIGLGIFNFLFRR